MEIKEIIALEVTGNSILKATYRRQMEFIEEQLRTICTPLNDCGDTCYSYYGNIPNSMIEYFEDRGFDVIIYDGEETRRENRGKAMYVFIPDEDLSEDEIEDALATPYKKMDRFEQIGYTEEYTAAIAKKYAEISGEEEAE